jgi:hypothetical protein
VIADSYSWKVRLDRELRALSRQLKKRDTEGQYESIEWFVFTSSFIMRKLLESQRLSHEAECRKIRVRRYPATSAKTGYRFTEKDVNDRYDFSSGKPGLLSLEGLCNQIVHSYDFIVASSGGGRVLLFNSDRSSRSTLSLVTFSEYLSFVRYVTRDDWDLEWRRDLNDPDRVYELRMRRSWSAARREAYFAKFNVVRRSARRNGVHRATR